MGRRASRRFIGLAGVTVLLTVFGAAAAAVDPAQMNKATVHALYEMKLSQSQADAMAVLIRQAVDEVREMLRAEVQRSHALPDQDGMARKARVVFDRYDPNADAILDDAQWPAYERFKRYAVQRICSAGFEISGKEDGPGVKLVVVPKPLATPNDPAPTNSGEPQAAPPTDR